jgi:hypothetical protein
MRTRIDLFPVIMYINYRLPVWNFVLYDCKLHLYNLRHQCCDVSCHPENYVEISNYYEYLCKKFRIICLIWLAWIESWQGNVSVRHEDVWGNEGMPPCIHNLGTYWIRGWVGPRARNRIPIFQPTDNQLIVTLRGTLKAKAKAVPLHATEALGGRGGIAPTHSRPRL